MKFHSRAKLCVLALAALLASPTRADVLSVVPSDSLVIVKVKDLNGVSKKLAGLSEAWGISAMNPQMADPIGSIKEQLNIKGGVNETGDAALVVLNFTGEPEQPPVLSLLPVSDYAAFIANFEGATTENGITTFSNAADGETVYVAQWGDYAAVSPSKDAVVTKGAGVTLPAGAVKELAAKDAVIWANMPVIKTKVLPLIAEKKVEWRAELIEGIEADENARKFAPVLGAVFDVYIKAAETFLNESQGSFVSLNITDAGLNLGIVSEFAEGSYIGKFAAAQKGGTSSFLTGLPSATYLVFGGGLTNGAALRPLFKDLVDPILAAMPEMDAAGKTAMADIRTAFDTMLDTGTSATFGVIKPKGQLGQEAIFQTVTVVEGKSEAYLAAMKKYFTSVGPVFKALTPEGSPAMPGTSFIVEPAAVTAAGVTFDRVKADINADPKTPEEAQIQQMMTFMYGPAGLSYLLGAADEGTAIMAQGLDDAALAAVVESSKANKDAVAGLAHVKETADQLPADRSIVFYVSLDEIATTAVTYISQFGMPVKFQLPPNLPPLGFAVSNSGSSVRIDYHVPTKTVQSFVAATLQTMNEMQGGGM
jgi:hypothetical protein